MTRLKENSTVPCVILTLASGRAGCHPFFRECDEAPFPSGRDTSGNKP